MNEPQNINQNQPYFNIERIYLKELSLEQPNSPEILLDTASPEVAIEINVGTAQVQQDIYQVAITATVTTTIKERVVFLVEAQQAGIFTLRNIPAEQIAPMLEIACANIIYPYLRASIADIITRAGFAPIHLAEINFQMLYERRLEQASATNQTNAPKTNGNALTH